MEELLITAITGMDEDESLRIVREMLEGGIEPMQILDLCRRAMEVIGNGFETGEYFLPDLIMSGEILGQIAELVKPRLGEEARDKGLGRVLIGTVAGDIHDLGKNIVIFLLEVNGFEVIDLGVDVAPERFVEEIRKQNPQVVGMSCLLTIAYDAMKKTVDAISEAGLRDKVKIMVGGGTVDEQVRSYAGADAFGADAVAAVSLARTWIEG
jgi:methylmalonyl-CoA mutase cobalamin-binding domain/chain